jgi:hypothetical protein
MRMGLQVGFGHLVGRDLLDKLRNAGFTLIRIDCQTNRDPALAQEVIDAGLQPLVIIRDADQIPLLPEGIDIEFGNEPDIEKFGWTKFNKADAAINETTYAAVMRNAPKSFTTSYWGEAQRAIAAAKDRNPLWIGVVSNLNARGFRFLSSGDWSNIPSWVGCSVHRYPDGNSPPEKAHLRGLLGKWWKRADEITELRKIVGSRPLGVSEIGYHTAYGVWKDGDVAKHMAWERQFFEDSKFDFAVGYQLNDGPADDQHHDSHFGFLDGKGTWKPVAPAWTT